MTVRVNKAAFNLREKLSELTSKFGLKGTELARAETVQDARDLISAGRKNLIINGGMQVSQRLGSSGENDLTGTTSGFSVDRFKSWQNGGGELKLQQSTNAPPGFTNSLLHTVNTADISVGANDYYMLQQRIEGFNTHHLNWGTSNAKDVTLSFWVRSSVSGVYSLSLWRGSQTYNYVTDYTINNVNTWEYKTITIPGPTGGTWATTSGTGVGIWWDLGSGTTYSTATTETWGQNNKFRVPSQASWISTGSAEFRMTGVQLEVGTNATDFEYRSYGEELALCQRYYQQTIFSNGHGGNTQGTNMYGNLHTIVSMRANPTVGATGPLEVNSNGVNTTQSSVNVASYGTNIVNSFIIINNFSGLAQGKGASLRFNANQNLLTLEAEL